MPCRVIDVVWWDIFNTKGFVRRGDCGDGYPGWLLWEMNVADLLTFFAYVLFSMFFLGYLRRRHVRALRPIFTLIGCFFATCALSHGFPVLMTWWPAWILDAHVRVLGAIVSVGAVALFWPMLPKIMRMPHAGRMELLNREMQEEILKLREMMVRLGSTNVKRAERAYTDLIAAVKAIRQRGGNE